MTQAKVEAVNKLLEAGEPGNISTDEHAGYTGYKPQSVIDAMNEVFWGAWGFEEVSSCIEPGEKGGLAVAQVRVWLKDIEFRPTSWGQNRVTRGDIGDARKGAQTDAIKKALSYFSIGNRAYQGLLKEDSKPKDAGRNGYQPSKHAVAAKPAAQPTALKNGDGTPAIVTSPALKVMEVHQRGIDRGTWTKDNFYPKCSEILGKPVTKDTVRALSQADLAELDKAEPVTSGKE